MTDPPSSAAGVDQVLLQSLYRALKREGIHLSPRELECCFLVAEALPIKEIAERLHVSRRTIPQYLQKVYVKLGVHSRAEVVLWIIRAGYEEPPGLEDPAA